MSSAVQKRRFFAVMDRGSTIRAAAIEVGVSPNAGYSWVKKAGLVGNEPVTERRPSAWMSIAVSSTMRASATLAHRAARYAQRTSSAFVMYSAGMTPSRFTHTGAVGFVSGDRHDLLLFVRDNPDTQR